MRRIRAAYYVWTDLQIINCLNLKLNNHLEYAGDLYYLGLDRITESLVKAVCDSGAFENVIKIAPITNNPDFSNANSLINKIKTRSRLRNYYSDVFKKAISGRKYDRLVLAGFWADGAGIAEEIYRINRDLKIDYIEEGLRHGQEVYEYTLKQNKIIRFFRWFYDGWTIPKWKKLGEFGYFYDPDRFDGETDPIYCNFFYEYKSLPAINNSNNRVAEILLSAVDQQKVGFDYRGKKIILLQPGDEFYWTDDSGTEQDFTRIADLSGQIAGKKRTIIRCHPSKVDLSHYRNIDYDNDATPLELKLLSIYKADPELLDGVVLVCYYSSVMINVFSMFNFPVKAVILYKLSADYHKGHKFLFEYMLEKYRKTITDKNAIFIPHSSEDYLNYIKKAIRESDNRGL